MSPRAPRSYWQGRRPATFARETRGCCRGKGILGNGGAGRALVGFWWGVWEGASPSRVYAVDESGWGARCQSLADLTAICVRSALSTSEVQTPPGERDACGLHAPHLVMMAVPHARTQGQIRHDSVHDCYQMPMKSCTSCRGPKSGDRVVWRPCVAAGRAQTLR